MTYVIREDGREPVRVTTLDHVHEYLEERAFVIFDAWRDPNSSDRFDYPGLYFLPHRDPPLGEVIAVLDLDFANLTVTWDVRKETDS